MAQRHRDAALSLSAGAARQEDLVSGAVGAAWLGDGAVRCHSAVGELAGGYRTGATLASRSAEALSQCARGWENAQATYDEARRTADAALADEAAHRAASSVMTPARGAAGGSWHSPLRAKAVALADKAVDEFSRASAEVARAVDGMAARLGRPLFGPEASHAGWESTIGNWAGDVGHAEAAAWRGVLGALEQAATHPSKMVKLDLDVFGMASGALLVAGGAASEGLGLTADATGAGAVIGVPVNLAGFLEIAGGLTATGYAADQTLRDLQHFAQDAEGERGLRPSEEATLPRLQQSDDPRIAGRTISVSPSTDEEYIDDLGRTHDQMGDPQASAYWDPEEFKTSIDDHLLKSADFIVIDMTGFTTTQADEVRTYVDTLSPEAQARIIRIAF